jgi:glycosyltransferase involved in cell wall biosynthesis
LPALLSNTKAVIAISESTKEDIIQFLKYPDEKIHVIYNGYDPAKYFVADDNSDLFFKKYGFKKYFLAVGPNYPHKNFEFLLNAYQQLSIDERNVYPLIIAGGKEPYLTSVKQLIQHLGLQKNVHYIGYVPEELMPAMYREAFALIFPSLYEGFGMPPLEAMACGCPVIASNTSSLPEVCGDGALYIDPTDQSSLLTAMESLISNQLLYNELKEKGLKQASKFSWEKTASALKSLLENKIFLT